jgi:serine/threonine protein kinase
MDLNSYLKNRPMREKYAKIYLKQLMEKIKSLREQNIFDFNIKPSNLRIIGERLEFTGDEEMFIEGPLCAPPYYMAPEVMHNKKYLSRANLWSIGILMYKMLYGCLPYTSDPLGPFEWREKIDTTELQYPSFPEETANELSEEAVNFLKELLQKDPSKRISWERYLSHPWFQSV